MKISRSSAARVALLAASSLSTFAVSAPAAAQAVSNNSSASDALRAAISTRSALIPTLQVITNDGPAITPAPTGANLAVRYANSNDLLDHSGVNGVGQMISITLPFLNLCTGTLINPRTVITAAHCVYEEPKQFYGSNTGVGGGITPGSGLATTNGIPLSFGFESTNRCRGVAVNGCASGTGPYEAWLAAGFNTVAGKHIYNANQVWYGTGSQPVELGGGGEFGNEDIALVTLDTHVSNVPTWTLLFSPLTSAAHATVTGYGVSGVGLTPFGGAAGIDYRRRSAENMVDALMSSADWAHNPFIGGPDFHGFDNEAHTLYWMDFDDPHFNAIAAGTNPNFIHDTAPGPADNGYYDFNGLGGHALPHEGVTGGGDSGGPLIIDQTFRNTDGTFRPVVAGVLTGSWSFGGSGYYGEFEVYPPLYLYWQEIVANNPYKYVSAKAGNGDWMDPAHWVQDMDPNYAIVGPDGQLLNSLPSFAQVDRDSTAGRFGTVCALDGVFGDFCSDAPTSAYPADGGVPLATSGGPGSTNFVPNNIEPVNSTDAAQYKQARYYDVTLRQAGRTTLNGAATIDKLTLDGPAQLNIGASGNLKVWAEFNQAAGWTNIDGTLKTGEALVATGLLSGKGVFDPTFLTVVGGVVAPGGKDIGTLTIKGNMIMASASALFVDATRGSADKLVVQSDADGAGVLTLSQNETTNARPSIVFNKIGEAPRQNESYVIATAAGGITGKFDAYTFQGVLRPELTYGANSITATLRAGSLVTILDGQNPTALAFANALDQLRTGFYDKLWNLYGNVDWMNGTQLNAMFNALSPVKMVGETELLQDRQSRKLFGALGDRLSLLGTGQASGLSFSGAAMPLMRGSRDVSPQAVLGLSSGGKSVAAPMSGGLSGFVTMSSDTVQSGYGGEHGVNAGQHSRYYASGVEAPFGNVRVGTAVGYAESVSEAGLGKSRSKLSQAAAYASVPLGGNAYVGGIIAAEQARSSSNRLATDTVSNFRLTSATHSSRYMATAEAGFRASLGHGLSLNPRAQLGYSRYSLDGFREQGGETALELNSLKVSRLEAKFGAKLDGSTQFAGWTVSPQIQADYVRLVSGGRNGLNVSFAAAPDYAFALPLTNGASGWAEIKGGMSVSRGAVTFGVLGQATAGDAPISDQRGLVSFSVKF